MTNEYEKAREAITDKIWSKMPLTYADLPYIADAILALKKQNGSAMLGVIADDQSVPDVSLDGVTSKSIKEARKLQTQDMLNAKFVKIVEKEKRNE